MLKLGYSATPEKEPFSHHVYIVSAVLDPNLKLDWIDLEISENELDIDTKDALRSEIKGRNSRNNIACCFVSVFHIFAVIK